MFHNFDIQRYMYTSNAIYCKNDKLEVNYDKAFFRSLAV